MAIVNAADKPRGLPPALRDRAAISAVRPLRVGRAGECLLLMEDLKRRGAHAPLARTSLQFGRTSASGTKRTIRPHSRLSAIGGKADSAIDGRHAR